MFVLDANVLVHAVNEDADEHAVAAAWLRHELSGREAVGFAWTAIIAFLRVSTHPVALSRPLTASQASAVMEHWLGAPPAVTIEPTRRHLPLLRGLLGHAGTGGNLVNDAHLAALALEYGATVVSFDRDFARFDGLSLLRPG